METPGSSAQTWGWGLSSFLGIFAWGGRGRGLSPGGLSQHWESKRQIPGAWCRREMGHSAHPDGFSGSLPTPSCHQHADTALFAARHHPQHTQPAVVTLRSAGRIPRAMEPTCGREAEGLRCQWGIQNHQLQRPFCPERDVPRSGSPPGSAASTPEPVESFLDKSQCFPRGLSQEHVGSAGP